MSKCRNSNPLSPNLELTLLVPYLGSVPSITWSIITRQTNTIYCYLAVPASSTVTMATETVTIEKAYFEALLRRWVRLVCSSKLPTRLDFQARAPFYISQLTHYPTQSPIRTSRPQSCRAILVHGLRAEFFIAYLWRGFYNFRHHPQGGTRQPTDYSTPIRYYWSLPYPFLCYIEIDRAFRNLTATANLRRNLFQGGIAEETLTVGSFKRYMFWF